MLNDWRFWVGACLVIALLCGCGRNGLGGYASPIGATPPAVCVAKTPTLSVCRKAGA